VLGLDEVGVVGLASLPSIDALVCPVERLPLLFNFFLLVFFVETLLTDVEL